MTEQVHQVKGQQQEEEWVIAQVMIILVFRMDVRIGDVDMEGDSMAVQVRVMEPDLASGVALEVITLEISLMYLKRH
ncbi:MAG: hypothetical protein ABFS28_13120 [Bacteroidota bacterium]